MINTPTIYSDDESQVSKDLTTPQRRTPIWLAWFTANLQPQQWLNDLVFTKYYGGSSAPKWVAATPYNYQDDVLYLDNGVYECTNLSGVTSSTPPNLDTKNWIKILDTPIGIAERVKYTGQKSVLEYLLNRYFQVGNVVLPFFGSQTWYNNLDYAVGQNVVYSGSLYNCILASPAGTLPTNTTYWVLNPQIYIQRDAVINNDFWMATTSEGSPQSYMPIDTALSSQWMPITTETYQPNSFTIYVPSAVATAINAAIVAVIPGSSDTYITLITSIVSNYVRAAKVFNVTTY